MINEALGTIVETSNALSNNIYGYIIFISLIFMIAFMFMCWQVFNIFKSFIEKALNVFESKLVRIEEDVKEIKSRLDGSSRSVIK